MLTALIIDDELDAQSALSGLINMFCENVSVIGQADNIHTGIQLINELKPQILFLDVEIGNETGFDLLEQLEHRTFKLIFTTGHSKFAHQAFRVHANNYLLKPIDPDLLVEAIEQIRKENNPNLLFSKQLNTLLQQNQEKKEERLSISTNEGMYFIPMEEIVRLEGDGNFTTIYLHNQQKVNSAKNLKFYAKKLSSNFIKVHQSHIINIKFARQFSSEDGFWVITNGGDKVPVSRRKKDNLLNALKKL